MVKRKLISFRPRITFSPMRGCYFKVHVEQETGRTLLARRKLLAWIWFRRAWSGASLFRARLEDEDRVDAVAQHMLDDVLGRVGWPWRSGTGLRW